jgi:hypothetical protein
VEASRSPLLIARHFIMTRAVMQRVLSAFISRRLANSLTSGSQLMNTFGFLFAAKVFDVARERSALRDGRLIALVIVAISGAPQQIAVQLAKAAVKRTNHRRVVQAARHNVVFELLHLRQIGQQAATVSANLCATAGRLLRVCGCKYAKKKSCRKVHDSKCPNIYLLSTGTLVMISGGLTRR